MFDYTAIPGFSNYLINTSGVVYNKTTGKFLSGSINPDGYFLYRIKNDDGHVLTVGRYRLMALTFIPDERDTSKLVVNHIDGDKTNDVLNNLEWVTELENIQHAGRLGLTSKCRPVETRDVLTGEIRYYHSSIDCARDLEYTRDAIAYRLKAGSNRVFPEGKQYRWFTTEPWPQLESIGPDKFGRSVQVMVLDALTGIQTPYTKLSIAANHMGVCLTTAYNALVSNQTKMVSKRYYIKPDDGKDWNQHVSWSH